MAVHVDEIHSEIRARASTGSADPGHGGHGPGHGAGHGEHDGGHGHEGADGASGRPAAGEDVWRRAEARVTQLRCRVAAVGFDD